jgi:hypothetical protein
VEPADPHLDSRWEVVSFRDMAEPLGTTVRELLAILQKLNPEIGVLLKVTGRGSDRCHLVPESRSVETAILHRNPKRKSRCHSDARNRDIAHTQRRGKFRPSRRIRMDTDSVGPFVRQYRVRP